MPAKGSRGERVFEQLRLAPCNVADILKRHADFGVGFAAVTEIYEGLIARGCVELVDHVYSVTSEAKRYLDQLGAPVAQVGQVAGPAYRPKTAPLAPPRMRQADMREGASDYLAIQSRVGDQRYSHGSMKPSGEK